MTTTPTPHLSTSTRPDSVMNDICVRCLAAQAAFVSLTWPAVYLTMFGISSIHPENYQYCR
jgi:hypothetical protein